MNHATDHNSVLLETELTWLAGLLQRRLDTYFASPPSHPLLPAPYTAPALTPATAGYAHLIAQHELSTIERAIIMLALSPLLRPQLLEALWIRNPATQRGYSEFGGVSDTVDGHFTPTVETALFLLAGNQMPERLATLSWLNHHHRLFTQALLQPLQVAESGSLTTARLLPGYAVMAALGLEHTLDTRAALPAQRVTTGLCWEDLVLPAATLNQLEEVRDWLHHGNRLLHDYGLGKRLRPGYTCLFHGPPGTGKTLSATLLGKLCQREVYRVDLSMVVSKYIGETEKNLARVFDLAEQRGWILFFDEADALFGQRTRVDSAHDRYANQEVSYLLQRIEDFTGVVILSSNLRSNIDEAFVRRFQSVIAFSLPEAPERHRLWLESLPSGLRPEADLQLERLAEKHAIAGGTIINVVRYAVLKSLVRGDDMLTAEDIDTGLRRELLKEGRGF